MKIAIVTPWFGRELIGGAERHAWELAHALAAGGTDVDVLSTCSRSFNDDWATNFHRAGTTVLAERLRLVRFRVDSRDRVAYGRVTAGLTALPRITLQGDFVPFDDRDARVFVSESIGSRALAAFVNEHAVDYDAFIFLPYLYGTTLAVLPHVAERAFLMPCLHDEAYAYMEPVRSCVAAARGLLFLSAGEEETAASIYGPGVYAKSRVVGASVEPVPPPASPMSIGGFVPNRSRYVLYLGRQVVTKNVDFLIDAYRLFRERRIATSLQLVLAGQRSGSRGGDGIVDLGPVNRDGKAALLTYARALAQPSLHESFSRTVYESWFARRPVFVHGQCRATARAVEDSGGGWIGSTLDDWARMFSDLDESSDDAVDAVGQRGWAAALDSGTWEIVARRALEAIETGLSRQPLQRIDQLVPLGDRALASHASALGDALRESGGDVVTAVAESASVRPGSRVLAHVIGDALPVPADVYLAHDPQPAFAPTSRICAASHEVAAGLEERGIVARVVPLPVSAGVWNGVRPVPIGLNDGRPILLSIAPLGAFEARRLLDVFVAFLGLAGSARLLVFSADCDDEARAVLVRERNELDLENEVMLVGGTVGERYAAYRAASVAMVIGRPIDVASAIMPLWFDLPIVSVGDPGSIDAIEGAALIEEAYDARRLAALLRIVVSDEALRRAMRIENRRVRDRHSPRSVASTILEAFGEPRSELQTGLPAAW